MKKAKKISKKTTKKVSKKNQKVNKKSQKKKSTIKKQLNELPEIEIELSEEEKNLLKELTEKQKQFVFEYLKTLNATQSYLKIYQCSYNTAKVNSCLLLTNTNISKLIKKILEKTLEKEKENLYFLIYQQLLNILQTDITFYLNEKNQIDINKIKENPLPILSFSKNKNNYSIRLEDKTKVREQAMKLLNLFKDNNERIIVINTFKNDW